MLIECVSHKTKNINSRKDLNVVSDIKIIPIWTMPPKTPVRQHPFGFTSAFPVNWSSLCCVKLKDVPQFATNTHAWNSEHELPLSVDLQGHDWCKTVFAKSLDPLPLKQEILSNRSRAAGWVMMCLMTEAREIWSGLIERDKAFLWELWELVFSSRNGIHGKDRAICMWGEDSHDDSILCVLTPSAWRDLNCWNKRDYRIVKRYLPDPGLEWKVIVHHNLH